MNSRPGTEGNGVADNGDDTTNESHEEGRERDASPLVWEVGPHPVRDRILDLLETRPGATLTQIQEGLDLTFGVTSFHVHQLMDADKIVRFDSPRGPDHAYFLIADADAWDNPRTRLLFGRETLRLPAIYIVDHPGCTSEEISDALDTTPRKLRPRLRGLKEQELVVTNKVRRKVHYHPLSVLEAWAEGIGQRFERPWGNELDA